MEITDIPKPFRASSLKRVLSLIEQIKVVVPLWSVANVWSSAAVNIARFSAMIVWCFKLFQQSKPASTSNITVVRWFVLVLSAVKIFATDNSYRNMSQYSICYRHR